MRHWLACSSTETFRPPSHSRNWRRSPSGSAEPWVELSPPRYAMAGGMSFQSASTAHVVADGTIVIAGVAMGTAASTVGSACNDGAKKKAGYQWHHLATNKNESSTAQGGPWTPLFQQLFAGAGLSLDDSANLVYLAAHQGPHSKAYHEHVYNNLSVAMEGCHPVSDCRNKLVAALKRLARDVCTPGSRLHRLLTQGRE
jgi:hypothetical protein